MSSIVCSVRGGPESRSTILRAIALAKESGLSLCFLYVVNLDFLVRTSLSRTRPIAEDMRRMGEFILMTAQDEATAQGVVAKRRILQGDVSENIVSMCRELDAVYAVVGKPLFEKEKDVFSPQALAELVARIEQASGAEVILVNSGDAS